MHKQARKRGANYTQEEKSLLLDLIMQYKHIVESKKTDGIYVMKKKEAWNAITIKYNSICSSRPRDTDQLKALFDNMKQKCRKVVGESNIEMHTTGGGFWNAKLTDNDAKVLAIIQEQVQPLSNPNDSASSFYEESEDPVPVSTKIEVMNEAYVIPPHAPCPSTSYASYQEIPVIAQEPETPLNQPSVCDNIFNKKKVSAHKINKIQKNTSAEALKRLYFKKKCQNADLERKKLMREIVHQKREHNLRIKILKNNLKSMTDIELNQH